MKKPQPYVRIFGFGICQGMTATLKLVSVRKTTVVLQYDSGAKSTYCRKTGRAHPRDHLQVSGWEVDMDSLRHAIETREGKKEG